MEELSLGILHALCEYTDKDFDDFFYSAKGLKTKGILEVTFRLLVF